MDYYLSDEVKSLKDWKPKLGEKYWFVSWDHEGLLDENDKKESFALREIREGNYGIAAYRIDSVDHFNINSGSKFKKVLGIKNEFTNLSEIKNVDKIIPVGTQLYYNNKSFSGDGCKAGSFKSVDLEDGFTSVDYLSGGWDELKILKVKTKDIKQMKYEDKWHLNDGTKVIPSDADTLCKDGSVVAYRLPIKEPKVGDMVKVKGRNYSSCKLLYIHHEDPKRKYAVVAFEAAIPQSFKFEDISLAD